MFWGCCGGFGHSPSTGLVCNLRWTVAWASPLLVKEDMTQCGHGREGPG